MYAEDGIIIHIDRHRSRIIPWDSSREVTLKRSGERCVRRTLRLRPEHFPLPVIGGGLGGFRRERDVGRTLVVDFLRDGRRIDVLLDTRSAP